MKQDKLSFHSIFLQKCLITLFSALLITRLIGALGLPPIQDEAYYFLWSHDLDLGYFDHPPLVAFMAWIGTLKPGSVLLPRLLTLCLSMLSLPILISFFRRLSLKQGSYLTNATILAAGSAVAVIQGYITTPDIPMIFCWIVALHEAAVALDDQPKRWLSAGFFTGLGILGKYTMVLIGPVFLMALLAHPKKLRQIWPYLGGLACVITIVPHLIWLKNNDWLTLRFQFGRGLQSIYDVDMQIGSDLPWAVEADKSGREQALADFFKVPEEEEKPKIKLTGFAQNLSRLSEFLGGQLALYGFMLIPLGFALFRRQWQKPSWRGPAQQTLAWTAAIWPLAFFAMISPFQSIEANWPAMYLIGAAAILSQSLSISSHALLKSAFANMILAILLTAHVYWPVLSSKPQNDRILKETHGYLDLGRYLESLNAPILVDNYQNASQLAFYSPRLRPQQWPGVARTSELVRRKAFNPWTWTTLQAQGSFYILTDNFVPPHIQGAEIDQLDEILDCYQTGLKLTRSDEGASYIRPCSKKIRRWSLARYKILEENAGLRHGSK